MTVTITSTPAAPRAAIDACRIDVAGAALNDAAGFNSGNYPSEPEVKQYLTFEKGGQILGKSYVFSPDSAGAHSFMDYIFPSAGSWSIKLRKSSDDSVVQTQAVTVS